MSRNCWRRVPKDLQKAVYATWRGLAAKRTTERLSAYRAARDAAIAAASQGRAKELPLCD
jgi:hypothetical protein